MHKKGKGGGPLAMGDGGAGGGTENMALQKKTKQQVNYHSIFIKQSN